MALRDQTSAMAFMSQHFVALMCDYETHNADGTWTKQEPAAFSGFLLELHGIGFWVTAGHCLKDELDKPLRRGQIRITGGAFLDHFGHEAVFEQGVPFTYEVGCGYYVEDPKYGLDFALIKLDTLKVQAFLNNKLVFISRANWEHQHKLAFDFHLMLGLIGETETTIQDGKTVLKMEQVLIKVDQINRDDIEELPPGIDELPSELWFIGTVPPKEKIESIKGTSGGPIYGFRYDDQKRLAYHVVALQSRWWPEPRITFGCPLPLFAEECYRILGPIVAELKAERDS
jgi:hypothetical protein